MTSSDRLATLVWFVLMIATVITTWVLSKNSFSATEATLATIAIAGWKVRLVLLHFMEMKHAPWLPRLLFEGWIVLAMLVILVPYFLGTHAG